MKEAGSGGAPAPPKPGSDPIRVLYASRNDGIHDRRFIAALEDAGMTAVSVALEATKPAERLGVLLQADGRLRPDVIVAGPLLDVALAVVRAGLKPVVGISFAFDLLVDALAAGGGELGHEALAGCDALVCDAEAVAAAAIALGMRSDAILRLPWGVDLDRYPVSNADGRGRVRVRLGWSGDERIVLVTRSHEPLYRMPVVVAAFRLAASADPRLRLLVLGDGTERPNLERAVADAGLTDRVRFVGRIDNAELPDWYAAADCYVSASPVDGSSVSLLEAMATGLPVVVPNVGGNPEWVAECRAGWLVPRDDPNAMASAMLESVALDETALGEMQRAARHTVETRADWRRNAPRFAALVARIADHD